jgi:hypothetical protein
MCNLPVDIGQQILQDLRDLIAYLESLFQLKPTSLELHQTLSANSELHQALTKLLAEWTKVKADK